jgi:hypothetical protein
MLPVIFSVKFNALQKFKKTLTDAAVKFYGYDPGLIAAVNEIDKMQVQSISLLFDTKGIQFLVNNTSDSSDGRASV